MTAADTHTPVDLSEYRCVSVAGGVRMWHRPCGATVASQLSPSLYDLLTAACAHDCPQARP